MTAVDAGSPDATVVGAAAVRPDVAAVSGLVDSLGHTMRLMQRLRTHLIARDHHVDWGAHQLLVRVHLDGPVRITTLAESMQSDASTVSRQASALVKEGLVARVADPHDGRAGLLELTARGRERVEAFRAYRDQEFSRLLEGWSQEDALALTALLDRFTGQVRALVSSASPEPFTQTTTPEHETRWPAGQPEGALIP